MLAAQHNAIIELSAVPDKIQGAAAVERCAAISARAQTGRNNWPPSLIICLAPCCLVCFPERCGDHHTHRMSLIGRIIAACYRIRCAWKRRYNRTSWHLYCNRSTLSSRYGERSSPPAIEVVPEFSSVWGNGKNHDFRPTASQRRRRCRHCRYCHARR
jgi:hypothetical protein